MMSYSLLTILCTFSWHWTLGYADNTNVDVNAALIEVMAEVKDLKLEMSKLKSNLGKISNLGDPIHVTENLESRIETLETELRELKASRSSRNPSTADETSTNNLANKLDELQAQIEENSAQIFDLNNTCTCTFNLNDTSGNNSDGNNPWGACASAPCAFGATCLDMNGTFVCLCSHGNFGPTCADSFADATFLVTSSSVLVVNGGATIVFDEPRINSGLHYDNATGLYTVPVRGVYTFTVHLTSNGYDHVTFYLDVDGESVAYTDMHNYHDTSFSVEKSVTLTLNVGQTVSVVPASALGLYGTSADGVMWSWFTGHLVHTVLIP